ncbi:hypothetical protein [Calidithermus timidus]|jgi:hypothetical protein|uniref:hypothetical protein n=1 Tax=Calidithermus timidus TaxID=307124 RepID=UPI001B7F9D84|nr:hypothetical protein [Calidithermus timidus]
MAERRAEAGVAASTDAEGLLGLLLEPCCPICTLSRQAALSYLDERLTRWRLSPAPTAAETGLAAGVLCSQHWRKLVMLEAQHGAGPRLSEVLLGEILEAADAPRPCPVCEVQQAAARHYLGVLSRLPTETLGLVLRQGEGFVCLRHLMALPTGPLKGWLLERVHTLTLDLPRFQQRYARHHGIEEDPQAALAALEGGGWLA